MTTSLGSLVKKYTALGIYGGTLGVAAGIGIQDAYFVDVAAGIGAGFAQGALIGKEAYKSTRKSNSFFQTLQYATATTLSLIALPKTTQAISEEFGQFNTGYIIGAILGSSTGALTQFASSHNKRGGGDDGGGQPIEIANTTPIYLDSSRRYNNAA